MAKNEPAAGDKPDKDVQPDNQPADAPSQDQPKDEPKDQPKPEPKQDFTPDEDEPKEGEPKEDGDKPPAEGGDQGDKKPEGDAGDGEGDEPVSPQSKHYYERQLKKRDDTIDKLTTALEANYVNQGTDDADKRIRAVEASNFVREVQTAQNDLIADNQRAQGEIDIFNPSKPDVFREEIYDRLKARYARDYLITQKVETPDGQAEDVIVGYRVPFYDFLREEADLITGGGAAPPAPKTPPANSAPPASTNDAERKMRANADVPGGSSNRKEGDKDPFLVGLTEKPQRT